MKLHTLTPHESRMCPIDFGVKRSTVKVMAHGYLKMVHRNNGCRFEFVGVGGGPVLLQQYFQYAIICCPYMLPLLFENGFRTITDSVINLWSWNFIHLLTMSQGCALLILRSKGQRSRSWRMVIWKWFPDDNWLCNQPMIMKLHTLTPHESRMCPIDFGVKRSTVKVMAHGYLKMVHRNNGCRFEFVGVGGGPVLLQQYFQYAFICCPSCCLVYLPSPCIFLQYAKETQHEKILRGLAVGIALTMFVVWYIYHHHVYSSSMPRRPSMRKYCEAWLWV